MWVRVEWFPGSEQTKTTFLHFILSSVLTHSLQLIMYVAKERGTSLHFSTDYSYCENTEIVRLPQVELEGGSMGERRRKIQRNMVKIIGKCSTVRVWTPLCQRLANISVKGQIINIFIFAGHTYSLCSMHESSHRQ